MAYLQVFLFVYFGLNDEIEKIFGKEKNGSRTLGNDPLLMIAIPVNCIISRAMRKPDSMA